MAGDIVSLGVLSTKPCQALPPDEVPSVCAECLARCGCIICRSTSDLTASYMCADDVMALCGTRLGSTLTGT